MSDLIYAAIYGSVVLVLFGVTGTFLYLAQKQK